MDSIIKDVTLVLVGLLDNGGTKPVILLLLMIIGALGWQVLRMQKQIDKKDDKIEKILDDYHKGNMTLAEALNQLKLVLYEIRVRL